MKKKILIIFFLTLIPLYLIYRFNHKETYIYLAIGDELAKGHTPFNTYGESYADYLFTYLKTKNTNAEINKKYIDEDMRITDLIKSLKNIEENSLTQDIKKSDIITISIGSEEIFNKLKTNYTIYKTNPTLFNKYIDTLFINLTELLKEMNLISEPLKNILIIGGGKIAYYLAKTLISKKYKVKLIENNEERAVELAESLPKATIICGDGTDHDLLVEEGIETTDSCIALTNIDEENIIISMYAKKLKLPKVIAKIKRSSFLGMLNDLGIVNAVSPQDIVASKIVSYIRAISNKKGSNVLTLYKLVNNQVEALEFHARKKERIYNKPLKDLKKKENCLIACIIRDGDVIIPGGNDCIKLDDHVLVVTTHPNFDDLMDVFE